MTNQEYHDDKTAISSSQLKMLDPPELFKLTGGRIKENDSMKKGTAVHTLVLEPEKFEGEYFIGDGRSAEAKAAKAEGKIIISEAIYRDVNGMAESVKKNGLAMELLAKGEAEKSFFWEQMIEYDAEKTTCHYCGTPQEVSGEERFVGAKECPVCGNMFKIFSVRCKARPDFLGDGYFLDLKTAESVDPYSFTAAVKYREYHMSAAMYAEGLLNNGIKTEKFYWLVVQNTYPYITAVYEASEDTLIRGYDLFMKHLLVYRKCKDTDTWPGYGKITLNLVDKI